MQCACTIIVICGLPFFTKFYQIITKKKKLKKKKKEEEEEEEEVTECKMYVLIFSTDFCPKPFSP